MRPTLYHSPRHLLSQAGRPSLLKSGARAHPGRHLAPTRLAVGQTRSAVTRSAAARAVKGMLREANGSASVGQDAFVNNTACQLHDSLGAAACCGSRVLLHPACRTIHGRAAAARVLGSSLDFTTSPMGDLRAFENVDGKKCKRSALAGHSARARLRHDLADWLARGNVRARGYGTKDPLSQRKWYPSWRGCFGCDGGGCCTGRGDCELGVCICQPGWCGLDCGQPCTGRAAVHVDAERKRVGLAVYVYDLPVDMGLIQFAHRVWARNLRNGEMIYAAEWRFLELLLGDGAHRALRPEDADLFYIPLLGALGPVAP